MSAPDGGILVVCTANVCRSPMAEFALRRGFEQRPGLEGVAVVSAGVRVAEERSVCTEVIAFRDESSWAAMGSEHRARSLEPAMIRAAALIVTATREQRSWVVAAAPEMRGSAFTLREALWLGREYEREESTPAPHAVAAFREHIHGMRGLRPLPTPARRRFWRSGHDPLDIPDGHGGGAREHHGAMRAALAAGNELAELIAGRSR